MAYPLGLETLPSPGAWATVGGCRDFGLPVNTGRPYCYKCQVDLTPSVGESLQFPSAYSPVRARSAMVSSQYLLQIHLRREEVPSFEKYPFVLPAVRHLDALDFHPKVTFFIGENGSGKSTLLAAFPDTSGFKAEGPTTNIKFDTRASHS